MTDTPIDAIGDNLPPADADPLRERLAETHADLETRKDDLLEGATHVPMVVKDEETAGKVADYIKQIAACMKNSESHRKKEKEEYLELGRQVDGFFKKIYEPLGKAKKEIERRLTLYQREVEAEERRVRQKAELAAREEAERAVRAAEEAAAAIEKEDDLEKAVEAEERAKTARADAEKAKMAAEVKAAELTRTRGDYGGVASLRTRWTGHLTARSDVDLEKLRQHLSEEALSKAIRSYVKAGGRELAGARIYEDTSTVVR